MEFYATSNLPPTLLGVYHPQLTLWSLRLPPALLFSAYITAFPLVMAMKLAAMLCSEEEGVPETALSSSCWANREREQDPCVLWQLQSLAGTFQPSFCFSFENMGAAEPGKQS